MWVSCTGFMHCVSMMQLFSALRICSFFSRSFVSRLLVDVDMEIFTGNEGMKLQYGYDVLHTTSNRAAT